MRGAGGAGGAWAGASGRFKCLAAVTKLAACVDGDVLLGAVEASPLLGYVAGYLASGVPGVEETMGKEAEEAAQAEASAAALREPVVDMVSEVNLMTSSP